MRIEYDPKLDFDDVLIRPKRSRLLSRKEVNLVREFTFPHSKHSYTAIPIIAANMDHTGTFEMADALAQFGVSVALHKHYDPSGMYTGFVSEQYVNRLYVPRFYSMGIAEREWDQLIQLAEYRGGFPKYINIDIANGYSEQFAAYIKRLREKVEDNSVIMAGNVVTGDMTQELILAGADIVKVGIGPGSVCTTRLLTGVGYPQLSAIIECADAAHGLNGLICGDGGCKVPGDVAKAFAGGADFIMLGGMFAGHDECAGEILTRKADMKEVMTFYGMSSDTAMEKYAGGVADYRASEGKTVEVPYKGPVSDTIKEILGGVRSACTYVGAERLKDLSKCTTFVMVNRQLNDKFGD